MSGNSNTLTVTVPITFTSGFAGNKNVYLWASSAGGQTSGYAQRGTWSVPGAAGVPSTVSVTPSSGSGNSGNFQFAASDTAGYADLAALEVVIALGQPAHRVLGVADEVDEVDFSVVWNTFFIFCSHFA